MAATFAPVSCPADAWTQIADGATYAAVGIQLGSSVPVKIAIAAAPPAVDAQEYIVLTPEGDESFSAKLAAADIVYGQGQGRAGLIRGYGETA